MTHINWNERFDTGIAILDFQHRKLIAMINQLHDSSLLDPTSVAKDNFKGMREYAAEHFSFEEELMQAADYPYIHAHSQLHQRFLERIDAMLSRQQEGGKMTRQLTDFLAEWLTHHIGYEDQDYVNDVRRIMKDICN